MKDNVDGNLYFLNEHEKAEAEWENNLPVCAWCGHEFSDDHYYEIMGEVVCPQCIDDARHWY